MSCCTKNILTNKTFLNMYYTSCAKGVAILLVVLSHVASFWGVRWFTPLGGIGVSMFLILSGYGLAVSCKNNGLKFFFLKRLIAVYIPYVLINLLGFVCIFSTSLSTQKFMLSVLLIKPSNAYWWYMQYLFIWYLIFWLVNKAKVTDFQKNICFCAISLLLFTVLKKPLWAEQSFSFLIGICLAKNDVMEIKKYHIGIVALVLGIGALVLKQIPVVRALDIGYIWNFIQLINKLGVAVGIIMLLNLVIQLHITKILYCVGLISFEIYLVHSYTINIINSQLSLKYVWFVVCTAIISMVFYIINKRLYKSLSKVLCK